MARTPFTDREVVASIPLARIREEEAARVEPRAVDAYFDTERGRVVIELKNGCAFAFPAAHGRGLENGTSEQLGALELEPGGEGLHWEELDADISIPGLIARLLNLRDWAPRMMGQTTSEAKTAAARLNGMKGGRPRKEVIEPTPRRAASKSAGSHKRTIARTASGRFTAKGPSAKSASKGAGVKTRNSAPAKGSGIRAGSKVTAKAEASAKKKRSGKN